MKTICTLSIIAVMLCSCKKEKKVELSVVENSKLIELQQKNLNKINPFTNSVELAHKKNLFKNKKAIQYDIEISFGGKPRLDATITQYTDDTKVKISNKNGSEIVFDGEEVFLVTDTKPSGKERFDIFTWSYFFALPYKLNDPGSRIVNMKDKKWGLQNYETSKLIFDSGIGDTPDDWYVLYKNPKTDILEGAAYIVSYGKKLSKAEKDPHAIKFANFINVEGVPFATSWSFHNWNLEYGYSDVIGKATISNIKFVNTDADFFEKTKNAIPVSYLSK